MFCSFASYDPLIWFATRQESTLAIRFFMPICSPIRKPAIKASYSASLLDASNSNLSVYVNSSPSGFVRMSPAPDPPMDEVVELPCAELLNENRTLIRKYPKTFLCLVGLSRSFVEMDMHPTLLHGDNKEMGLLDFLKTVNPFKVKTGEKTLAQNEVSLLIETEDRVIAPASQPMSLVDHTIHDELNVNSAGKSPSALQRLSRQNEQASTGYGSAAPVIEDVTSSFATPTPDFAHEDASHDNVVPPVTLGSAGATVPVAAPTGGDHPASGSGPEAGTLSATPSQGSSADDFYESQTIDSAAAQNIYVPNWNVINNDQLASPVTCQNLLDHVTSPAYWAAFRNQHDAMFLNALNVNSAQHRFRKSEAETVEVAELRRRVSDLEATVAVRVGELANLRTENVSLSERVSALELERVGLKDQVVGEGKMREEFLSQQDAAEQHFKECAAELDARIADVRRDMDNNLYLHMLTTIAGQRWVVGHGFRLAMHKCANSVKYQSALGKVISMAINKGMQQGLEAGVVHGQADELEGLKDAPLASIMSALTLKDSEGDKDISSKLSRIRRSAERRGLCPPSGIAPGEAFAPSHDTSLAIADYQVSTLVLSGDGASVDQPLVVEPHDDLFDASILAEPSGV
ncbi:hypothetical protein Tco_0763964 [Tanacetum coccineum]